MLTAKRAPTPGFTLIELLVVVAILAVLMSLLLPALGRARAASKLAACGSNLRQIGFGIHAYAIENGGYIPRGPDPAHAQDFTGNRIATNQLWIGAEPWNPPANQRRYQGLGPLLVTTCPNPKVLFCPADDNYNVEHSEPHIGTEASAYGSYTYRQLDHIPEKGPAGLLDEMGENVVDGVAILVETLALDTNSLGPAALKAFHTNHDGRAVNVLYRDAAVRRYRNQHDSLAIPAEAFGGFPADASGVMAGLDQLLTNADYAYRGGQPCTAPQIVPAK